MVPLLLEVFMKLSDALHLPLDCGGKGRCGKCKVYVSGELSPLTPAELSLLTQEEIDAGCRLACQAEVEGEYVVHNSHKDDDMVVQTEFGNADSMLTSAVSSTDTTSSIGVAVDIGTTTLAAYWYDLATGQLLDQRSAANPQRIFGADVISRIERAMNGDLIQLSSALRRGLLALLPEKWDRLVLTGNTTMLYTLCGHDPEPLSHAPFIADHTYGYEKDGVILPPCFSAYVGADLSTAALAAKCSPLTGRYRPPALPRPLASFQQKSCPSVPKADTASSQLLQEPPQLSRKAEEGLTSLTVFLGSNTESLHFFCSNPSNQKQLF